MDEALQLPLFDDGGKSEYLSKWKDEKRVNCEGQFMRFGTMSGYTNAMFSFVRIGDDDAEIEHIWVSNAFRLGDPEKGSTIRFTANIVGKKWGDEQGHFVAMRYNLVNPILIESPPAVRIPELPKPTRIVPVSVPVLPPVQPEPAPQQSPEPPRISAANIIRRLKDLARDAGGYDSLTELIEAIK
jgi:hypothetical protein